MIAPKSRVVSFNNKLTGFADLPMLHLETPKMKIGEPTITPMSYHEGMHQAWAPILQGF